MEVDITGTGSREPGTGDSIYAPAPGPRLPASDYAPAPGRRLPVPDLILIRRLAIAAAAVFIAVVAFWRLDLLYSHKFFDNTGRAQWIWPRVRIAANEPVAFFATREFDLPPNRWFTRIKMLGDPEYTLYFNGVAIGGRRVGDADQALDTYDVSKLARDKGNRMVVAVRSANGVGGLIAAIDLTAEFGNFIVTGSDWHIVRGWSDDLLLRDPPRAETPQLFGRPPIGRWNYLQQRDAAPFAPIQRTVAASDSFTYDTALRDVAVVGGTAITVSRKTRATAFDFGPTSGRVRLTLRERPSKPVAVNVRFAYDRSELEVIEGAVDSFVFAPGERTVLDEQPRRFRYVAVYGSAADVEVVQ